MFGGLFVNESNVPTPLKWLPATSLIKQAFEGACVNEFRGEHGAAPGSCTAACCFAMRLWLGLFPRSLLPQHAPWPPCCCGRYEQALPNPHARVQALSLSWMSEGTARAAGRRCWSASHLQTPPSARPWPTRAGEAPAPLQPGPCAPGCRGCTLGSTAQEWLDGLVAGLAAGAGAWWVRAASAAYAPCSRCESSGAPLYCSYVPLILPSPPPTPTPSFPGRIMLCYWWYTYCILVRKQPK